MKHRTAIEDASFSQVGDLFGLSTTVTLYDLTNTYFEGEAAINPKARRGPSKEKRTDCPLVTLGLVLDGSGFIRRSEVFAGNVAEGQTLAGMLQSPGAPGGALAGQCRVTATFRGTDGRVLHVRQATRAEPAQRAIYQALNLNPAPGGITKMIV